MIILLAKKTEAKKKISAENLFGITVGNKT